MTSLDQQIADLEERIINAPSIEGAAAMHDQLDRLRERRGRLDPDAGSIPYRRGYRAGYKAARDAARRRAEPPCNHEGIGYPWCQTCRPRTVEALKELGVDWTDRYTR